MLLRLSLSSSPIPHAATAAALALGLLCAPAAAQEAPPGLIKIKGGKAKLGSTEDQVTELMKDHQGPG